MTIGEETAAQLCFKVELGGGSWKAFESRVDGLLGDQDGLCRKGDDSQGTDVKRVQKCVKSVI